MRSNTKKSAMTSTATTFAMLGFSLAAAASDGGMPSMNATIPNVTDNSNNSSITSMNETEVFQLEAMLPPQLAESLLDASSPSFAAAEWMARQSWEQMMLSDSNPNSKVLQRFALATLFFATDGENWDDRGENSADCEEENVCEWLTVWADECRWFGITCNEEGMVTKIDFREYKESCVIFAVCRLLPCCCFIIIGLYIFMSFLVVTILLFSLWHGK